MALLMYHDVIEMDNPDQQILNFLESSFQAGKKKALWPDVV